MTPMTLVFIWSLVSGASFIAMSIPLIQRRVGPNRWYGAGLRRTLVDPQAWYAVSENAGWAVLWLGVAVIAVATTLYFVPGLDVVVYGSIVSAVGTGGLAIAFVRSFRYLLRLTKEKTDRETGQSATWACAGAAEGSTVCLLAARFDVGGMSGEELFILILISSLAVVIGGSASLVAKEIWAWYRQRPRLTRCDIARAAIKAGMVIAVICSVYAVLWLARERLPAPRDLLDWFVSNVAVGGGVGLPWGLLAGWWVNRLFKAVPGKGGVPESSGVQSASE